MLKIYKASAGSGKTYTLAYEYIRTLLGLKNPETGRYRLNPGKSTPEGVHLSNRHRHILAITFTNKATEEMKKRIIKELHALVVIPPPGVKDTDYAGMLCKEFGCDRRQLSESASTALEELLDAYSDFNVTTIDSFFQRVLRTFARELDRQGDFAIEINDRKALQMTVNTMLDDFNRNPEEAPALKQWLIDFMMRTVDEGSKANFLNRSSRLYSSLVDLATEICNEKFKPYSEEMRKYLGVGTKEGAPYLSAVADKLHKLYRRIPYSLSNRVNAMWRDLAADGVTPEMLNGRAVSTTILRDIMPAGKVPKYEYLKNRKLIDIINGEGNPFTKMRFKGNDTHVERVREELRHAFEGYNRYYDYQILLRALPQLSLLAYAWKYLDDIITDNNTVLLSDTNHMLQRIIGSDETPFIYERMGVNLTNFLIDEFQDTSKMQWENLRPLVKESLSHRHDNLIIGDEKQSIYRFRNSDSSLLHYQVANVDFPEGKYDTRVVGDESGDNTNWRSAADVVRFNNTLFTILASRYGIEGYDNVIQQIAGKNADLPGYVRFINSNLPDPEAEVSGDGAHDDAPAEAMDVIDVMARDIRRQHDECGYSWKDIAVLVSRNVEGAKVIERLSSMTPRIPVVSSESMLLRKSTAVLMVVAILNIYAQGHLSRKVEESKGNIYPDTAQLAAIISQYKYLRQQDDATCETPYHTILKATKMAAGGENPAEEVMRRLISRRPSSLVSLIETVIHEFVGKEERDTQSAYLAAFVDFAVEWSQRNAPSLSGFLEAWEQQKDKLSVTSASDEEAVTVITVHKSKGLEYDCVHIPFGSWREARGQYSIWIPFPSIPELKDDTCPPAVFVELTSVADRPGSIFNAIFTSNLREERVDNLNKTYVAYTRAGRELTVYYNPKKHIGQTLKSVFDNDFITRDNPCLLNCDDDVVYDSASGNLTIGEPTRKRVKEDSGDQKDMPEAKSLNGYNVTIYNDADVYTRVDDMLDDNPVADDTGDESTGADQADDFIDEDSRLRGIALHDIISRVITADDAVAAVRYYAMRNDRVAQEEESFLSQIKTMLAGSHPKISQWFASDADVLTEQTIYLPDTGRNRRLDRVVRYPDGSVDIIDYKFTTTHNLKAHRPQVMSYIRFLRQMGYRNVRGYLWYPLISTDDIIEVN